MRLHAAILAALLACTGAAFAQAPPDAEGVVARYLTTPYGEVNGLRLENGTLALFAPHLAQRFFDSSAVGDLVRLSGRNGADGVMRATGLVNLTTRRTVAGLAPVPPAPPANRPLATLERIEVAGTVELVLRGPRGEANAVILHEGAVVYFRPNLVRIPLARQQPFAAIGIGTRGSWGPALEAVAVGADLAAARAAMQASIAPPSPPSPPHPQP